MLPHTSKTLLDGLKRSSDDVCWERFNGRYGPLVLAVALRMGLSLADAQDAVQETMGAFLENYREGKYDPDKGRLRDWLCGITAHKVRDIQRRNYRQEKNIVDQTDATGFMNQIEDHKIEEAFDCESQKAIMRQCLEEVKQQVTTQTFESFELYALQQWPVKKVAGHLQISEDVVYQNKRRVLKRVREMLPKIREVW